MALGKRAKQEQNPIWIEAASIPKSPGHPFYERLNTILAEERFDEFCESTCAKFYAEKKGRPSIPPGVYFRMLMIGYYEGIDSERGIAWRCKDSLGLRAFLGYPLTEDTPDHSSLSRVRSRIDEETHDRIFQWVLELLERRGFVKGKTLAVDATTLEANAAMRSIVRRDTGESYQAFLVKLARESGIETPTREDLARFDKKRDKTTSNDDWTNPSDPDAKITKMKDGRTHLAHKAEHGVDLDTGAVLAVTVQGADEGDTTTIRQTTEAAIENLGIIERSAEGPQGCVEELVTDKGYHSNAVLADMAAVGIRTYVSEPKGPRRKWKDRERERRAFHSNRRRVRGERGKSLLRRRGEVVERTFAHVYDTGGMRRTHLRGHPNILKRLLIHICGFNLALLMRGLFGIGKPRGSEGRSEALFGLIPGLLSRFAWMFATIHCHGSRSLLHWEFRSEFSIAAAA